MFFFSFRKKFNVCLQQSVSQSKQTNFLFEIIQTWEKFPRNFPAIFIKKKKFLFSTNWQWRKKIAEKNILIMTYLIIIRCSFVVRCNHVNLEKYGFFLFFVCKKNINLTQISIYKEFYGIEMMMICSIIVKLLYS